MNPFKTGANPFSPNFQSSLIGFAKYANTSSGFSQYNYVHTNPDSDFKLKAPTFTVTNSTHGHEEQGIQSSVTPLSFKIK